MAYRLREPKSNIHKRHRVIVYFDDSHSYNEIADWVKQNLKGGFYTGGIFYSFSTPNLKNENSVPYYFVKKDDAALFKLRWG